MSKPLRNDEDPFPDLLQNHPRPMWIFDHKTLRFLDVNAAAVADYGYTRLEFLKMKITEIRPQDQVPKLLAEIRPFGMEGVQVTEWQHLTRDKRLLDVEITSSQFVFRGRPAVFIEVHDITERKRAIRENAMFEERNRMAGGIDRILAQLKAAQQAIANSPVQACWYIKRAELLARQSLTESPQWLWGRDSVGELTLRERQVLELLTAGNSNKEIAAELEVTEGTVKIHVNHILRKLRTTGRTEAAIFAVKSGIVRI